MLLFFCHQYIVYKSLLFFVANTCHWFDCYSSRLLLPLNEVNPHWLMVGACWGNVCVICTDCSYIFLLLKVSSTSYAASALCNYTTGVSSVCWLVAWICENIDFFSMCKYVPNWQNCTSSLKNRLPCSIFKQFSSEVTNDYKYKLIMPTETVIVWAVKVW